MDLIELFLYQFRGLHSLLLLFQDAKLVSSRPESSPATPQSQSSSEYKCYETMFVSLAMKVKNDTLY